MPEFVKQWLRLTGSGWVNRTLSSGTVHVRELFRQQPAVARRNTRRNRYVAVFMDSVVWRFCSLVHQAFVGLKLVLPWGALAVVLWLVRLAVARRAAWKRG